MNTRSVTFRLVAWCTGVSLLMCAAVSLYTYFGLKYFLAESHATALRRRADQIDALLASHLGKEGEVYTIELIRTSFAPEHNDRFIRIRRANDGVLYQSGWPFDGSFDPQSIPLLPPSATREVKNIGNLILVQSQATILGQTYLIDCGSSRLLSDAILRKWSILLGLGMPLVLAGAVMGGRWLVRHSLRPVRRIIAASRDITSYNLSQRLPVNPSNDEIEHLSIVLNQMIARLDEAFQHARRLTADASHELRTPLTVMRIELESAAADIGLGEHTLEKIGVALEEAERLTKTVEALFSISRLEAGEAVMNVNAFDLSELAQVTAEQMALLAAEKSIELCARTAAPAQVMGDRFRIKQVIVNLLDNAIKYTPAGGQITLTTLLLERDVILEVADNGIGIPAEDLPRVFDRFFRADAVRTHSESGAGLGLSIVRSICLAHGGLVEAANQLDGGCRITVRLPRLRVDAELEALAETAQPTGLLRLAQT